MFAVGGSVDSFEFVILIVQVAGSISFAIVEVNLD